MVASGVVVAVALSAGCDGSDPGEATRTAAQERVDAPATARLEAHAAQTERWAHLQGQARTYGAPVERPDDVRPNPIEAGNGAVAEHARALLAAVQDHRLGAAVALLFLQAGGSPRCSASRGRTSTSSPAPPKCGGRRST